MTNCEWFTSELGEIKHHLQAHEKKYKASGLAIDCEIHESKSVEYEQCRVSTKRLHYTNAVLDCDGKQGGYVQHH